MEETETHFTIGDEDEANIRSYGKYPKAKDARCPKCNSACITKEPMSAMTQGKCWNCGFEGNPRKFVQSPPNASSVPQKGDHE